MVTLPVAKCCACGEVKVLRNILTIERRAPEIGTGWGCVQCGLPQDGAVAIVCDDCLNADTPVFLVCLGHAMGQERIPLRDLSPKPFSHNLALHPEITESLH